MKREARNGTVLAEMWYNALNRFGRDRIAIVFQDRRVTFGEIEEFSNKIAHFMLQEMDIQAGDVVGLCMSNCPEFIGVSNLRVKKNVGK